MGVNPAVPNAADPDPVEFRLPTSTMTDADAQPSTQWPIHSTERPQPRVVKPPANQWTVAPPADAVVLFGGADLMKWKGADERPARWKVENGYMEVVPGAGAIVTRDGFGDAQLHVEWAAPLPAEGESQERGNSGVFLMGRYEVQVLEGRNNINFFGYAGVDLAAPRTGAYGEYHVFPNYLITYLVENERWRVRFRKNPGFALLSESRVDGPEPGRWRRMEYRFARDGTIRLSVDGALVREIRDGAPLRLSGRHGLRTWRTRLRYRNFKVYALPR